MTHDKDDYQQGYHDGRQAADTEWLKTIAKWTAGVLTAAGAGAVTLLANFWSK